MTQKETLQIGTSAKRFELGPMDYVSSAGRNKGQTVKRYGLQEVVPDKYEGNSVVEWKAKFQGERIQLATPEELDRLLGAALEARVRFASLGELTVLEELHAQLGVALETRKVTANGR